MRFPSALITMDNNPNLFDKYVRCVEDGYITFSDFLDEREQSEALRAFSKAKDCRMIIYGKQENFERGMAVFVPSFLDVNDCGELSEFFKRNGGDPICCLFIGKDRFSSLKHRDYLGALMGMGIERKTIGDIVVGDSGAYVFVVERLKKYILDNLSSVGRGSVRVEEVENVSENSSPATELVTTTVPSMRLDNVVSAAFKLSRAKAAQAVLDSTVFVNGIVIEKPDAKIAQGDKIVLRKSGKAIVKNIVGKSKKDRFIVEIEKFV